MSSLLLISIIFFLVYSIFDAWNGRQAVSLGRRAGGRQTTSFSKTLQSVNLREKLAFNKFFLRNAKYKAKVELMLLRGGFSHSLSPEHIIFIKQIVILGGLLLLWRFDALTMASALCAAAIGFVLPDFFFKGKVKERQQQVQKALPGFIDLLALTMESGLDLIAATDRIVERMKPGPLRDELLIMMQESRLGTPRKETLQHLAHRVDLSDLQSLISVIIQSEELGSSLAQVLRTFSEDLRSRRISRAEERAGKAPVKILFPMVVFFIPIVFVVIFGPVGLDLLKNMR